MKVIKRNGSEVEFDKNKIIVAITKANEANVSHELKTPIAVIQGYAEGLAEGVTDDAESREYYCNVIIDEAKKMDRMVLSMISLNQIESGNSEVTYHRFDIVEMI